MHATKSVERNSKTCMIAKIFLIYATKSKKTGYLVKCMLNKNTLGVKKVRGQSEATMVI